MKKKKGLEKWRRGGRGVKELKPCKRNKMGEVREDKIGRQVDPGNKKKHLISPIL